MPRRSRSATRPPGSAAPVAKKSARPSSAKLSARRTAMAAAPWDFAACSPPSKPARSRRSCWARIFPPTPSSARTAATWIRMSPNPAPCAASRCAKSRTSPTLSLVRPSPSAWISSTSRRIRSSRRPATSPLSSASAPTRTPRPKSPASVALRFTTESPSHGESRKIKSCLRGSVSPWCNCTMPSRREFLVSAALTSLALAQEKTIKDGKRAQTMTPAPSRRPIIICAHNGFNYLDDGFAILRNGGDSLDAVLRVVRGPEDDPNDTSVGLGGLPNEDGVVELDSCCMHGPTRRAGAVAAVRDIKNASLLARAVMDHTGHVMLAGEGATKFGLAQGFPKENLLTDYSRKVWLLWKETMSNRDWWGPGMTDPNWKPPVPAPPPDSKPRSDYREYKKMRRALAARLEARAADLGIPPAARRDAVRLVLSPPTGTIHCSALNGKGEISGCTTTSGLAFKLAGRVGDSPIIGAGCYTDQDVGSAGATRSEERR